MIPIEPDKIPMPFAYEGGRNEILEDGGESTGEASFLNGFPPITQLPLSQGGIPPRRKDFNGILYILSAYAHLYQSGGTPSYSEKVDYKAGCIVYHNSQFYVCIAQNGASTDAGLVEPGTDSTCWQTLWDYLMGGSASNVGSGTNPVYLNDGKFTASSSTVGSTSKPIYMNSGTLTETADTLAVSVTGSAATATTASKLGTSTVGSGTKPIYLSSGTATASSSTVGSGTKPIYMSSGTLTASSSTVGASAKPVYLNNGTITASSSTLGSGTKPIYMSSGTLTESGSTVGSGTKPVYLNSGTITASGSTVGSNTAPIYLSSGTLTASTATFERVSAKSFGESGYIKYASGLIVQWGSIDGVNSSTTVTATFPTAFSAPRTYGATGIHFGGDAGPNIIISSFASTGVGFKTNYGSNAVSVMWIAIGY